MLFSFNVLSARFLSKFQSQIQNICHAWVFWTLMRSTSLSRLATLMLGIFGIAVTNKLDICLDTCNEKVSEEYQKIKYVMCSTFNARWNGCYYLFIGMACMPNLFKTAIHCIKWSCQIPSQFFFFVSGYIYWTAQKGLCRPRRM